jgi:flagellar motor switch protein FliG
VLCIALGPTSAAQLLEKLSPTQAEQVAREIATIETVDPDIAHAVLQEYRAAADQPDTGLHGGPEYAMQILKQSLGNRANGVLDKVMEGNLGARFGRLRKAAPETLGEALRGEHPQTLALILAHIEPRHATRVLEALSPELAGDVLHRIARMEKVAPDVLAAVESALSTKTDLTLTQEMTLSGGPSAVAKVLNLAGATQGKQLMAAIEQRDGEIASEIKALMFVFEDLILIDSKGLQRVLREVGTKELALALKAASEQVKHHIKATMSERAAAALEEEIEMLGPVRVRDVEAVHNKIIDTVRTLEDAGEIMVRSREGNDDIIA